ncbi:hypothetical protein Emed_002087 [Eimeria media]
MAVSRLLFCAASLAVLDLKTFANAATNTLEFGNELGDCLASLNTARGAASLGNLTKGDTLLNSLNYSTGLGKDICEVLEEKSSTAEQGDFSNGTVAVFALTKDSKDNVDCSAAVKDWQSGFSLFEQAAPSKDNISNYIKNPKALAFLTLYNPSGQQGLCKVATCTADQDSDDKRKYGLVCLTSPSVLAQTTMFTTEQWEKIVKVLNPSPSSASAAVPSLLAIAAVLAGVSLM